MRPALALLLALVAGCARLGAPTGALRVIAPDTVEVDAVINAARFASGEMAGYHAVVWKGGGAHEAALFQAEATDLEVLGALESLGGIPGNALTMASWDHRHDRDDPAADAVIAGPAVEVLLRLPGRPDLVPLADVLTLADGQPPLLDLRLGGHRALVSAWHSGCVVCLYSCPGSKVGNAAATVRDFVDDKVRYRLRPGLLPPDGTRVGVVLWLSGKGSPTPGTRS